MNRMFGDLEAGGTSKRRPSRFRPTLVNGMFRDLAAGGTSKRRPSRFRPTLVKGTSGLPNEGEISLKGLEAMLEKCLGGIGEFSHSEMVDLFEKIDTDGSGFIDKKEFGEFLRLATEDQGVSTVHGVESVLGDDSTIEYMKTIDLLEDWGVFYCGGSNKIKNDLKEISRKYGLNFAVEKFDW